MTPAMIGYLLATGAIGVATALGYNTMAPQSQLYGSTFTGGGRNERHLALTFDDGPNEPYTMNLLEVLDRYGVKATFFMIGRYVNARPEIAATVARAGHVIGNHTFTHPNLIFCSRTQIRAQLADCDSALCDSVGEHSRLFRPPFGGRRPAVLKVANELELSTIMWDVTAYDWRLGQASRIEEHVFRQVRGGNVILLHDGSHLSLGVDRSQTVEATSAIIRRYHDLGFAFVTIPEMMDRVTASHQSPVAG